jgi:hypothetical protein
LVRIGHLVAQRPELEDLDDLVVEAVALLAEQRRTGTVEPDRDRRRRHHRR